MSKPGRTEAQTKRFKEEDAVASSGFLNVSFELGDLIHILSRGPDLKVMSFVKVDDIVSCQPLL